MEDCGERQDLGLSAQVFLQLDAEAKKQLEAMQKEIGAVKAAVAAAKTDASLDSLGGGTVKRTILDLYYRNAKLKVLILLLMKIFFGSFHQY